MIPSSKSTCVLVLLLAGCGGSTEPTATSDGGTADAGGPAAALDAAMAELTLDTCTTNVSADVPEPFKSYFRCVSASVSAGDVVLETKGLPPYKTYYWGPESPNYAPFDTSRGSQYRPNPNFLSEQRVALHIPIEPKRRAGLVVTPAIVDGMAGGPTAVDEYRLGPVGVALNGVILFDGTAAPGMALDTERFTFDAANAHPDMRGAYHYHTVSSGPLAVLSRVGVSGVELYGVMCDGAWVLGCTELDGAPPDRSDFDAQNGHAHDMVTKDGAARLVARYHVHLCPSWSDAPRAYTPEIQVHDRCDVR